MPIAISPKTNIVSAEILALPLTSTLLTTSEYPTYPENANLLRFNSLSKIFPDLILGYSDHTQGNVAACMAVAFGARIFEKHFTAGFRPGCV